MTKDNIIEEVVEIEDDEEDAEKPLPVYSITSYGADFDVRGLVRRINEGDIYIPPFQRDYVWDIKKASRFIESFLLGLPVPEIFLSRDENKKHLVIDGQQRLRTLQYFYNGKFKGSDKQLQFDLNGFETFALKNVDERFANVTYSTLSATDRRQLDDALIHATVVRQDKPTDDNSSIYQIFERLNTGGEHLTPQEIRACIYHGKFNELLHELNEYEPWRLVFWPKDKPKDERMRGKDQELILRFLALYFEDNYRTPMKEFLNTYMGKNRELKHQSADQLRRLFNNTLECIYKCFGKNVFKPQRGFNAAVFDAMMIGIGRRLEQGEIKDRKILVERYEELTKNEYFVAVTQKGEGTTSEKSVRSRICLAIEAFADVS